jgi:hypothetical protein
VDRWPEDRGWWTQATPEDVRGHLLGALEGYDRRGRGSRRRRSAFGAPHSEIADIQATLADALVSTPPASVRGAWLVSWVRATLTNLGALPPADLIAPPARARAVQDHCLALIWTVLTHTPEPATPANVAIETRIVTLLTDFVMESELRLRGLPL